MIWRGHGRSSNRENEQNKVKEVNLGLTATMERIVRQRFPKANLVKDRIHVQQVIDAVQQIRSPINCKGCRTGVLTAFY